MVWSLNDKEGIFSGSFCFFRMNLLVWPSLTLYVCRLLYTVLLSTFTACYLCSGILFVDQSMWLCTVWSCYTVHNICLSLSWVLMLLWSLAGVWAVGRTNLTWTTSLVLCWVGCLGVGLEVEGGAVGQAWTLTCPSWWQLLKVLFCPVLFGCPYIMPQRPR